RLTFLFECTEKTNTTGPRRPLCAPGPCPHTYTAQAVPPLVGPRSEGGPPMWLLNMRANTNLRADRPTRRRSRASWATRKPTPRLRPGVELLENRVTPAAITWDGTVHYDAFPGEANNVVFANGPYLTVSDDSNVGILAVPPFFLSSFLQSFNLSL